MECLNKLAKKYSEVNKKHTGTPDLQLNLRRIVARLKDPSKVDSSLQEFYDYTKELDSIRKQKFEETLPELYEIIKPFINWTIASGRPD